MQPLHISDCLPLYSPQYVLPPLQAFFNDKYMQENPEDLEKIEKLKDFIAWQVRLKFIMLICCFVKCVGS